MNLAQYERLFMMLEIVLHEQREFKRMVVDFSELVAQVKATQDVEASAVAAIQGIAQKILDAVSADETGVSQEVHDLATQLAASANTLATAVTSTQPPVANTDPVVPVSNTDPVSN